jgi:branched-subunit amino acid aminotransferase/4-amino-4-deoxychorismate lyase
VETTEALLTRADVATADEIFLTSSWLGIMPAASIEGRLLGKRNVGAALLSAYRKEIGEE